MAGEYVGTTKGERTVTRAREWSGRSSRLPVSPPPALLVWLAQAFDLDSDGGFWAAMGVLLVAGFALGVSQFLGGWTKWGHPTLSRLGASWSPSCRRS